MTDSLWRKRRMPDYIIDLAQSVGLTLPRRGDHFFINHQDLETLLKAEREVCANIAENWRCNGMPRTGVANEIRTRGEA